MKIYPPVIMIAAGGLMAVLDTALPLARLWPAGNWAGVLPAAAGFVLAAWSALMFRRHDTPVHPFKQANALVTSGPFAFSRNPIYLGMALVLLGIAIALGTLSPFLVIPLFMVVMTATIIAGEERMLEHSFADQYAAWRAKVRRWL